jgi:nicotinate-nucleotide pyrophosphorylase (carboxylating)
VRRIVASALEEDLGESGDVTTNAVISPDRRARGRFLARSDLVAAGLPLAREVFAQLDPRVRFLTLVREGEEVAAGNPLAEAHGPARALLSGERTALNFLMRMCGIATAARRAVREVAGTPAVILDTRKTAPGLRLLDKYAVAAGGATNHRMGLHDAAMVKDTHLAVAGSIEEAVSRLLARGVAPASVTVEVETVEDLERAIQAGAGRALLDNMDPGTIRRSVEAARGRIVLEASGGLVPGRLREVAETGVAFLSVGWLTHSSPAADIALELAGAD